MRSLLLCVVATVSFTAPVFTFIDSAHADFPITGGGTCPSCFTKHCELNEFGKPECECISKSERGTLTPNFYVTHVIYTPPGKSSSVTYGTGSTSGSTTSTTQSFKSGITVGNDQSGGFKGEKIVAASGVSISEGVTWGTTGTAATDITVENTSSRTVSGQMDLVDHGDDEIWFLIRPVINTEIVQNRTCSAPEDVGWSFARNQTSTPYSLYLRWLINPMGMAGLPDNVRADLANFGITERDFAEIAKAHPFATFNLIAQHSHKCLAVPASSQASGTGTIQYDCLGSAATDQGWRLVSVGGNRVQIVASHSNKCLAVPAGSQANGAAVIQYDCLGPGAADQAWFLNPRGDGHFVIRASHSGKCLAVPASSQANGTGLIQYDCLSNATDQLWQLRPISFERPTNASLTNPSLPGDSNRFEFVKRYAYEPPSQPGQTPNAYTDTVSRKVVNSSTWTTDVGITSSVKFSGTVTFVALITAALSYQDQLTWMNSTSSKQSDGVSTSHQIKVGQPASGYTGSTFLTVYHDKLWKTYAFVLDSKF